jgi:hypothetical protein
MAADRVLSSKPCSLQNADKSYTEGTFYVFSTLARFMARDGSGQKLEIGILDIKGDSVGIWEALQYAVCSSVSSLLALKVQ